MPKLLRIMGVMFLLASFVGFIFAFRELREWGTLITLLYAGAVLFSGVLHVILLWVVATVSEQVDALHGKLVPYEDSYGPDPRSWKAG